MFKLLLLTHTHTYIGFSEEHSLTACPYGRDF